MAGELLSQMQPDMIGAIGGVAQSVVKSGGKYLPFVGGGAAVLGGGFKSITVIKQEHVGLRTRLGQFRNSKGELRLARSGLRVTVPFTHAIEVISTQNITMDLARFAVTSAMGRQHDIESRLTWGIVKEKDYGVEYSELIYKAIMAARSGEELSQGVAGICTDGLRRIMQDTKEPDKLSAREAQESLQLTCGDELLNTYGVEIRRLHVLGASYSAPDMVVNGRLPSETATRFDLGLPELAVAAPEVMPGLRFAQGS